MIDFVRLELEHFKRFTTRVAVPLHAQGLVLVRSENRASAAADSNGAGKSALIADAIPWILYDNTVHKERGDAVADRFNPATTCTGVLHAVVDGVETRLTRTRRPSSFTVEHGARTLRAEHAAAFVEGAFKWGWATYCNAAIFGQRASHFALADSAVQRRVFEEVLDLDFSQPLQRAKDWRKQCDTEHAALVRDAAADAARLATLRAQHDELRAAADAFAAEQRARCERAAQEVAATRAAADTAHAARVAARRVLDALARDAAALVAYEEWSAAEHPLRAAVTAARAAYDTARDAQRKLTGRLGGLKTSKRCPTCLQSTTDSAALRARFQPDLDAAAAACDVAQQALVRATRAHDAHLQQAPPTVSRLEHERARARAQQEHERAVAAAAHAASAATAARSALAAVRTERFGQDAALARVSDAVAACAREAAARDARVARLAQTCAVAEYWVRAFAPQGIPNLVLESEEATLQERLDAHVRVLTRGEATVALRALERLKHGGVRERVTLSASWAWGAESLAGGSGGQDRRVNLAVFAAIQDLAELRSARRFPVKVFDEPCDALDARGKEIFLEWVRAQADGRATTFFVTHDAALAAESQPDHVWTVVLTTDGATVECD